MCKSLQLLRNQEKWRERERVRQKKKREWKREVQCESKVKHSKVQGYLPVVVSLTLATGTKIKYLWSNNLTTVIKMQYCNSCYWSINIAIRASMPRFICFDVSYFPSIFGYPDRRKWWLFCFPLSIVQDIEVTSSMVEDIIFFTMRLKKVHLSLMLPLKTSIIASNWLECYSQHFF